MIFVPNLEYCNNRMKGDVMQISKEELQSSSIPLAKALEEYLQHHLDIITDSDWFAELVEEKINKMGVSSNGKTSSSNLEDVGSIPTTSAKRKSLVKKT